MKRLWPCVFLLIGNEIVSYIVLIVLLIMFLGVIIEQLERRY
jgi:hypothetical protein